MARPKKTVRTVFKNIGIPEDLWEQVKEELHSEIEGRIPFGAQQAFFTKLLQDHFDAISTAKRDVQGTLEALCAEPSRAAALADCPPG